MPIWLLTFGSSFIGFFRKRPIMILYALLAVAAVGVFLHYRDLVSDVTRLEADNAVLTQAIDDQKSATTAAKNRAQENADALLAFETQVLDLKEIENAIRAETRILRQRLADLELEERIILAPTEAADTASLEYNRSVWLLECETDPSRDCTSPTGSDAEADTSAPSTD